MQSKSLEMNIPAMAHKTIPARRRSHAPQVLRVAHDLRNQLTTLMLVGENMLFEIDAKPDAAVEHDCRTLIGCIRQVVRLGEELANEVEKEVQIVAGRAVEPSLREQQAVRWLRKIRDRKL